MNTNETHRQRTLREYLQTELEDLLYIKPDALLFKSHARKKGWMFLVLSLVGIALAACLIYRGLTYQDYVYGWGIYILNPSGAQWPLLVIAGILSAVCVTGLLHWLNLQRSMIRIYVNEIKGNAIAFPGLPCALPVTIEVRNIRRVRRLSLHALAIQTQDHTYIFYLRHVKKAMRLLRMQMDISKSLRVSQKPV